MGIEYGVVWLAVALLLVAAIFAAGAWLERRARRQRDFVAAMAEFQRACNEAQAAIGAALLPPLEKVCRALSDWLERRAA